MNAVRSNIQYLRDQCTSNPERCVSIFTDNKFLEELSYS